MSTRSTDHDPSCWCPKKAPQTSRGVYGSINAGPTASAPPTLAAIGLVVIEASEQFVT
jgi:hypothetical protein